MESKKNSDSLSGDLLPDTASSGAVTRLEQIILLSIAAICLLLYFIILF